MVPRKWAAIAFSVVDGWADCRAYGHRFGAKFGNGTYDYHCHEPNGYAPECRLAAWLLDHNVSRDAILGGPFERKFVRPTLLQTGGSACQRLDADLKADLVLQGRSRPRICGDLFKGPGD